eukprot:gene12839-15074_t
MSKSALQALKEQAEKKRKEAALNSTQGATKKYKTRGEIEKEELQKKEDEKQAQLLLKGENEFANILKKIDKQDKEENKEQVQEETEEELVEEAKKSKQGKIYYFLWRLLRDWEEQLEARPDDEKKSRQGKNAMATYYQCTVHIKPLFTHLKQRDLPEDILDHVYNIVEFCKQREYVKANDEYLQMAIGNAPWPMGVTMVGIHERSSREKIFSNQVARSQEINDILSD